MASPHTCEYCYNLDLKNKRKYQDEYRCKELNKYCSLNDGRSCHYWKDKFDSSYGFGRSRFIEILGEKLRLNGLLLDLFNYIDMNLKNEQELIPELNNYQDNEDIICENILMMDNQIPFLSYIYSSYIVPCIEAFKNSSFFEVITIYKNMLNYIDGFLNINNSRTRKLESI